MIAIRGLILCTVVFCATTRPASAGPAEARALWKEAQAAKHDAPPERVRLFRAVRAAAGAADPITARAAAAEAKVLRAAERPEGAAAAEAFAAAFGPLREPDRLVHALAAARELLDDGDVVGGEVLLTDVLEHGGGATPATTGPALVLLAHLASERDDGAELERLSRRAAEVLPRLYDHRLAILDLVGLRRLSFADEVGARKVLAEEKRLYEEARRLGPSPERLAAKAWVALVLPKRLAGE